MTMTSKKLKVKSTKLVRNTFLLPFAFCLLAWGEPASAFKIVEPAENSLLKSGETITVKVDLQNDTGIIRTRYYWYGELDETRVQEGETTSAGSIVAAAALTSTAQADPPFGGRLKVPAEALGAMRLLAVGEVSRGRLGTQSVFDEIIVKVEPKADLLSLDFETEHPLRLGRAGQEAAYGHVDVLGKILELPVAGQFSDGISRSLTAPSAGTTFRSSNEKVIKVLPGNMLQLTGNGRAMLTAGNRGKEASLEVEVSVNDEPNEPPVADAGTNRTVKAGTRVELNGLRSYDPEGEALFYFWSQVRGNKVSLLDVNMPRASFVAPHVSAERLFRFKLRVTDKKGSESLPAFVDVTVVP
jgi:hypothetical protein